MKEFYTHCGMISSKVAYRGYDSNGYRVHKRVEYSPTLFLKTKNKTKYKTIYGDYVDRLNFISIKDAQEFIEQNKDIDNFTYYGNTNFHYCFLADQFPQQVEFDFSRIRVGFLDIETTFENGFPDVENPIEKVIAITVKLKNTFYVFGCKKYVNNNPNIKYFHCDSERELLEKFLDLWKNLDMDIISGWNVQWFDIPYLIARISRLLGENEAKKLSPFTYLKKRMVTLKGQTTECYELFGIHILDYIEMYKKYSPELENYRLNTVALYELKEKKISYDGSLKDLYEKDYQTFIDYNIQDVELVCRIDQKKKYIKQVCMMAYHAKVNYTDVFMQVRMCDNIIFNYFKQNNLVLPQKRVHGKNEQFKGAYVKDVLAGLHEWVVSFDLNSLYPSLIRQFNISPETLQPQYYKDLELDKLIKKEYNFDYLRDEKVTIAANGHHFRIDKEGFLGKILMDIYDERSMYKAKQIASEKQLEQVNEEIKKRGL